MWSLSLAILGSAAWAGDKEIYERAIELVEQKYLWVERFDAQQAFVKAAESAEDAVPWLIVEEQGAAVTLRHGEKGELARVSLGVEGTSAGIHALPGALDNLEDLIRAGGELPEEVDLPVELLRGVSRALDRHSSVLSRERLERFDERISGRLSGIGATITAEKGELVVKAVNPGEPAAAAGLKVGDRLLKIDGVSTAGMDADAAVHRIRGPEGSVVTLHVRRPRAEGGSQELDLAATRAEIVIRNVTWKRRPSGVGVLTIDHFSEQTAQLTTEALAGLAAAGPLRGLVVDLRGNTGGSMLQACRTADIFVDEGLVLRTRGRNGERVDGLLNQYRAHPENTEPDLPLLVLVDESSASASEILAGALSLLDRAVLIGTRTHGKGTVQKVYTLRDGEPEELVRFKLTVAEYLLEGDLQIEAGVGLEPDIFVESARFDLGGVSLPQPGARDALSVLAVEEGPGWRKNSSSARDDVLLELADRVLPEISGTERADLLQAFEAEMRLFAAEEEERLEDSFRVQGIDWQGAPEGGAVPRVKVELLTVDPPVAGRATEVRALVTNLSNAPLYRVRVHLEAEEKGLPWHDLTLPVGFIPPSEVSMGSAMVELPVDTPTREDQLKIMVFSDRRPPVSAPPALLWSTGLEVPQVGVDLRLLPQKDHHRLEVAVQNLGDRAVLGPSLRLVRDEDSDVALLDTEARLPDLAPRASGRASLRLHLPPGSASQPVDVDLRVLSQEGRQRVVRLPVELPPDGVERHYEAPQIQGELPLSAPVGKRLLSVRVIDEQNVESVTAWVAGEKVAWRSGKGRRLQLDVPVNLQAGTQAIVIEATDDAGTVGRRTWYVRGELPGDGAASRGD